MPWHTTCIHIYTAHICTHTHLKESKPLLQLLHWKHLDTDETHALNDADDGRGVILGVSDFSEESTPDRVEPGLREHTYHLSIQVRYLLHALYIGISISPRIRE